MRRRVLRAVAVAPWAMGVTGCATNRFRTPPPPFTGDAPLRALYIYSFLDVREPEFGPNFLAESQKQLAVALDAKGVRNAFLRFADSPLRAEYSLQAQPSGRGTSTRVPVAEVIITNLQVERAFDATHRMVVFPSSVTAGGAGHRFDVRWDIYETQAQKRVWSATSESAHTNWVKHDEMPVERAQVFVGGIIEQMSRSGVFATNAV